MKPPSGCKRHWAVSGPAQSGIGTDLHPCPWYCEKSDRSSADRAGLKLVSQLDARLSGVIAPSLSSSAAAGSWTEQGSDAVGSQDFAFGSSAMYRARMSAQLVELQLDRASARDANSERKSERLAVQ